MIMEVSLVYQRKNLIKLFYSVPKENLADDDVKKVIEENKDKDAFEQASAVQDKTLEECNSEYIKVPLK